MFTTRPPIKTFGGDAFNKTNLVAEFPQLAAGLFNFQFKHRLGSVFEDLLAVRRA